MSFYSKRLDEFGSILCEPLPSESDLAHYYREQFYQSLQASYLNDSSVEIRERDKEFYELQYGMFVSMLDLRDSVGNLHVDLACGYGHFLDFLSSRFSEVKLVGCEVFAESSEYIEKIHNASFRIMDLNSLDNLDSLLFDASSITLINALEHLRQPKEFLISCFENMKSGSRLLIQVPNDFNPIQMASVKQFGIDEWWFCPPRHISYFNPRSLSLLCSSVGFDIVDLVTTFPIDLFLLSGLNYRSDPDLGRRAHAMRLSFETNFVATHGIDRLISLYRHFASSGIGREIVISLAKP